MSGVNKVIVLGRLGQDPDLKQTNSGLSVCNFSVATSETWKDKKSGEKQEKTEWHRVVIWGKLADLANQYLKKGSQVYIEGRLETREWDDKQGIKRYTTEIIASIVQFIGGGQGEKSSKPSGPATNDAPSDNSAFGGHDYSRQTPPQHEYTSDDIPF
jgi:single-strand DNA-binding protein